MLNKIVALLFFFILLPIFVILAIIILLEDGFPVFFTQKRVGINNSFFKIYKFRSMKKNTPNVATHLLNNPDQYFNECIKVNNLFETIFEDGINPLEIFIETIKKVACEKYIVLQHQKNNILCPKGVFRIFSPSSDEFPYHTDGFNYGKIINNITNIDINLFPMIMNSDTNSIIAIILVLQQTDNATNEIDLHNCLVDDLELIKDEIGMYSHWMGTKYTNNNILKYKLQDKEFFSPILNTGDMYIFSASRIHKLNNLIQNNNRIVLATFGCVYNKQIILYQ